MQLEFELALWVECLSMVRETWVHSQVESYQRLKKWYLMPPCLTLSFIRYVSRVKWNNLGKGVAPLTTPWCSSYRKESLRIHLDCGHQLYLFNYFEAVVQHFSHFATGIHPVVVVVVDWLVVLFYVQHINPFLCHLKLN